MREVGNTKVPVKGRNWVRKLLWAVKSDLGALNFF